MRSAMTLVPTGLVMLLAACGAPSEPPAASEPSAAPPEPAAIVEVTARDYKFELPDPLLSGWTSFEFHNRGEEPHFFLLGRLPEGRTLSDYLREVGGAFGVGWEALRAGASQEEAGAMIGEALPSWFAEFRYVGGIGLVSPGETARTTLRLEPGLYTMECYVRTADGKFHTDLGMARAVRVTEAGSTSEEPTADLTLTLSNAGIAVAGEATPGRHVVAARFEGHPPAGLGNDVHLARLDGSSGLDRIADWMNWMNLDGMQTPAPARFLGGTQEGPVGSTAYFEVDLDPGRYVWLMEQPNARETLVEFEVGAATE